MRKVIGLITVVSILALTGCKQSSATDKEKTAVDKQQEQYLVSQPIPVFDWSLERDNVIKLYKLRNRKVSTYTVWRSDYGMIEGSCPSLGYGIPYDTSLTNPLQAVYVRNGSAAAIGQAEPNGVFASTNTAATWVMCVGKNGNIEPVYVESKVTTYPYQVKIDYEKNRVYRIGTKSVTLK